MGNGFEPAPADVRKKSAAGKGEHTIPEGDRLVFETPGGYGDPLERRAEAVAADVAKGLVSREAAERLYAVVLDEAGGLDTEATRARRLAAVRSEELAPTDSPGQ